MMSDEIDRTPSDSQALPATREWESADVIAETIIHVLDGAFLGELELRIPHLAQEEEDQDGRIVYVAFPDAERVDVVNAPRVQVAFRVSDLDGIIDAMQVAIARARAIPLLPRV